MQTLTLSGPFFFFYVSLFVGHARKRKLYVAISLIELYKISIHVGTKMTGSGTD